MDLVVGQFSISNNLTDTSELLQAPSASTRHPLCHHLPIARDTEAGFWSLLRAICPWLSSFIVIKHRTKPCRWSTTVQRTQEPESPPLEHHDEIREKGTDTWVKLNVVLSNSVSQNAQKVLEAFPAQPRSLGCCPAFQNYAQSHQALKANSSYIPWKPPSSFGTGFTFHLVPYLQPVANCPSFHAVPHNPLRPKLYQQTSLNCPYVQL